MEEMSDTPSVEAGAHHGPASRVKLKVIPSLSDYPRSHAVNYVRPTPITPEKEALKDLKNEWETVPDEASTSQKSSPRKEVLIAELHDFEIYRCPDSDRLRPSELSCLHFFDIKAKNLCFDGHVRLGSVIHYIERVGIHDISIEGYGRRDSPRVVVYLKTRLASEDKAHDIWLRLRNPALNYKRFHDPFLWVTTFAKFAIDYMDDQPRASVGLGSFRNEFHAWLVLRFDHNRRFKAWFAAFRNVSDFRVALHAYVDFIHNQAVNLSTSKHLMSHPVWSHCMCGRRLAIEKQPNVEGQTLVTPHVFESFKHMYFGGKLKQIVPSKAVAGLQEKRKQMLGFASDGAPQIISEQSTNNDRKVGMSSVQVGDVVSIAPDKIDKTKWKTSDTEWLVYVQGIQPLANGTQRLLVLWLYRPADTTICKNFYPITKEVFLSDNCNCKEREIFTIDIIRVHSVAWKPRSLATTQDLIIRQTYMTSNGSVVTMNNSHKVCPCRTPKPKRTGWCTGDTVYITRTVNRQELLEPVVIHSINHDEEEVTVRTLLRLGRDRPKLALKAGRTNIAPNELVLTNEFIALPVSRIKRGCNIRFVPQDDIVAQPQRIPAPYDKGGVGDHWFITMGLQVSNNIDSLVFLHMLPKQLRPDQEAQLPFKKLRGFSLFSGGGSLDRGLEEGGAVEFQTSVDYDSAAIHTQLANCTDPQRMRLFCGSVDDYLKLLISGDKNRLVARVGEVDLIAAGPPCPGFSSLQQNKLSQQSLTYASHITTFCTAVDVYRPLYGVLENVLNMGSASKDFNDQNVFSQLVACLVSMGYQVNQYIADSWTYGSFQRRSRIILTIAAPGLEPLSQPPHTHHCEDTPARSIGRLLNGERFGAREHYATPFQHVSAEEATSDLPDIGNGNVQTCIPFPDHRLSCLNNSKNRALLECIPRYPPGCGYTEAAKLKLIPPLLRIIKQETENLYQRIKANDRVPTITTNVSMQNTRNGGSVHWSQPRPLSIQEARRAQCYHDHEPIIGTLKEQFKIVGNGVDRAVSFSLGLALRDSCIKFSKRISQLSSGLADDGLEDEAEIVVDVEEDIENQFSKASEHARANLSPKASPPSSYSSSIDSFSSTQETRQQFDLSISLDGLHDIKPRQVSPSVASPQGHYKLVKHLVASEVFLSRLLRKDVERHSSPSLPTFFQSAQTRLPIKRQREDYNDERQRVSETRTGLLEREKAVKTRRRTSPAREILESEVELDRRASLPTPQKTFHTRSSGPVQFAPRAWHKSVGASNNVIELS